MRKMMRLAALVLALALALGAMAQAEPAAEADYTAYSHGGRVTLIDGSCVDAPLTGFEDAGRVVDSVLGELGGDARTELVPWRTLEDACGNRYYVFQQMCDDTTVLGGAVKVITDGAGKMLGLTSSIVSELPEPRQGEGILAEAAEALVLERFMATRQQALNVLAGYTDRMILPFTLEISMEDDAEERSRYVWVVYTDNPDCSLTRASELPYLAHYVTLDGEYLYSLPTIMPGDEAGASGFDSSYVFEFMEPVPYTGYVDLSGGEEKEITVTVMRDKRTGMYYLGDPERRIVVADCWEFLYGGGQVALESSPDNREWDQVALLSLYNYCRAYDYYKAIGWSGGDGLDTPIMILNDFCDIDHNPVDNAAYVGGYLGWQLFLASEGNDLSQCLDVLAHEFTHCVTGSVMTYNAYMNDYGAINEAISDIQGKTCQMLMDGPGNATWVIGDQGSTPIRSLSEPHAYQQPEYTWDIFYAPNVKTPTELNDQGGVHGNSSLLNHLAWRLYEKGGMTLEEGRAFWFTVDCAMVPGTDYAQLAELLPWALRATGLTRLNVELRRALDATRLGVEAMPDSFDADRALVTLQLPDNPIFDDEQWIMMMFSLNVDKLGESIGNAFDRLMDGDLSVLPGFVQALLGDDGAEAELPEDSDALSEALMDWARELASDSFFYGNTNAGQDGRTMRLVCLPGNAIPVLVHGVWNASIDDLEQVNVLALLGGKWIDLNSVFSGDGESVLSDEQAKAIADLLVDNLENFRGIGDVLDLFLYTIEGGAVNELPVDGLEDIQPVVSDIFSEENGEEAMPAERRMSRPKEDQA